MRVPFERRINPRRQNRVERIKWRETAFEDSSEPPDAVGFSCILAALRSKHRPRRAHKCAQTDRERRGRFPRISTRQEQPNNPRASRRESPGRLNYAQEHAHPCRRIRSPPNAVCFDTRAVTSLLYLENLGTSRVGITRHSAESQPCRHPCPESSDYPYESRLAPMPAPEIPRIHRRPSRSALMPGHEFTF